MKKIVIFGAGNIGRSFIAPLFVGSGFEAVFADVDKSILAELNKRKSYTVVEKSDRSPERRALVSPVRGIPADDPASVAHELADAGIAATAVGSAPFDTVIRAIGRAVSRRETSLDLILAENLHGASERARAVLHDAGLDPENNPGALGLVESSIGKMVPIMPATVRAHDPLLCWAEPYNTLLVDGQAFMGPVPHVPELRAVAPFAPWVKRKLYIHNMGHAAGAYIGFRKHPEAEYLWQVLADQTVLEKVREAMLLTARALAIQHPSSFSEIELTEHVEDLVARFQNRALGDTVYRVGRDLRRKLRRDDRVVGAIRTVMSAGLDPSPIAEVFAAAILFEKRDAEGKMLKSDAELLAAVEKRGVPWLLREVVGLDDQDRALQELLARATA